MYYKFMCWINPKQREMLCISSCRGIRRMNIKIELENTYYDFHFTKQTVYNLTVGNKYYFHKHTYGQGMSRLYLDLMMDYIDNNPFESIKVYEYKIGLFEYDNKNDSKINYADIKTKIKDGLLNIYSTYKIIEERSMGVVFELTPNYNISYLKVTYEGNHNIFDIDVSLLYIYIPIVLAIIIIIIVVICIIKKYKSKTRNAYYSSLDQPQNLILIEK